MIVCSQLLRHHERSDARGVTSLTLTLKTCNLTFTYGLMFLLQVRSESANDSDSDASSVFADESANDGDVETNQVRDVTY